MTIATGARMYENLLPCLMLRGLLFNSILKFRENNSLWKKRKFWPKWFIKKAKVGHRNIQDHELNIYFYSLTFVSQVLRHISFSILHASHDINKMILLHFEPCILVSFFKINSCQVHFGRSRHLCLRVWHNLNAMALNGTHYKLAYLDENADCFKFLACFFLQQVKSTIKISKYKEKCSLLLYQSIGAPLVYRAHFMTLG